MADVLGACAIDGCSRPRAMRDWCGAHYARWKRHGDPQAGGVPLGVPPEEAFAARTIRIGGCLLWQSYKTQDGYGLFWVDGRKVVAHRWAFEREFGPIPEGMQVDHICHQEACVNVEHLRLATPAQNAQYRRGSNSGSTTGVRNVYSSGDRYIVRIRKDGALKSYGHFASLEEAQAVAEATRAQLFGEFAGRQQPRKGNHPFRPIPVRAERRTQRSYADPTGETAVGNRKRKR